MHVITGALEHKLKKEGLIDFKSKRVEPRKQTFRPLLQGTEGFLLYNGDYGGMKNDISRNNPGASKILG